MAERDWRPRTLLDERFDRLGPQLAALPVERMSSAMDPHATAVCICGRKEWPGNMEAVGAIPPDVLGRLKRYQEQPLPTHICQGCRVILVREGLIDRHALAVARGAPPEVQAWLWRRLARTPHAIGVPAKLTEMVLAGVDPLQVPEALGPADTE